MTTLYTGTARPRLRSGMVLAPAGSGRWQIRWDFQQIAFLEGDLFARVLPWLSQRLTGTHDINTLIASSPPCTADEIVDVLKELENSGFLAWDTTGPAPDGESSAAASAEESPAEQNLSVIVLGLSSLATRLRETLKLLPGIDVAPTQAGGYLWEPEARSFGIAILHDLSHAELIGLNRRMLADSRPWMLAGAWNERLLIGPILMPKMTACCECFLTRMDSHREHLQEFRTFVNCQANAAAPFPPGTEEISRQLLACALIAKQLTDWRNTAWRPGTAARAHFYYPLDGRLESEPVLRLPWCAACRPLGISPTRDV